MKKYLCLVATSLYAGLLLAQDETKVSDVAINTNSDQWYASPWLWVAGAALFILLLVALTNKKNDG